MRIKPEAPEAIAWAMKRDNLTFRQVGEMVGASHSMLIQLIKGAKDPRDKHGRTTCSPDLAAKYERMLQLTPGTLFAPIVPSDAGKSSQRRGKVAA